MLHRLFFNIVNNAIHYTQIKGNISVSLSTGRKFVQITIEDNGIGISPENQGRVFDRFYRVDDSRSQTKGCGLGLAICKSIVELHGGKIAIKSALNQDSLFTISLPLSKN